MTLLSRAGIRALLLDIEGTITPISFVHDVLFPHARAQVKNYLALHIDAPETIADLTLLRDEHSSDMQHDREPPSLPDGPLDAAIDSFVAYIFWLMDRDRKSRGLKSLQGKIWEQGYADGSLTAPLFADVLPAIEEMRRADLKIAIFSSGSIFAQRLFFSHTDAGDVSQLIDCYFDTTSGAKTESSSYRQIAAALELSPAAMLFISDVVAELDAASVAGMRTRLCIRPGNPTQTSDSSHQIIETFAQLFDNG